MFTQESISESGHWSYIFPLLYSEHSVTILAECILLKIKNHLLTPVWSSLVAKVLSLHILEAHLGAS